MTLVLEFRETATGERLDIGGGGSRRPLDIEAAHEGAAPGVEVGRRRRGQSIDCGGVRTRLVPHRRPQKELHAAGRAPSTFVPTVFHIHRLISYCYGRGLLISLVTQPLIN